MWRWGRRRRYFHVRLSERSYLLEPRPVVQWLESKTALPADAADQRSFPWPLPEPQSTGKTNEVLGTSTIDHIGVRMRGARRKPANELYGIAYDCCNEPGMVRGLRGRAASTRRCQLRLATRGERAKAKENNHRQSLKQHSSKEFGTL